MGNFAKGVIVTVKFVALALLLSVIIMIFGKPLVTVLDRVVLSKPINFTIETGNMWLDDSTSLTIREFPTLDSITVDRDNRISIIIKGTTFPLGSSYKNPEDFLELFGTPVYLIPDKGNQVQIEYRHSYFGWLTPFEWNLFIHLPDGKRNSYYTLTWTKADGRQFAARWKFEEPRYKRNWSGWRSPEPAEGENALTELVISI